MPLPGAPHSSEISLPGGLASQVILQMLLWPQVSVCSLGTISKFSIKFFMDSPSCEAAAGERASCEAAAGEGVSCEASCTVVRVVRVFRPAEPAAKVEVFWPEPAAKVVKEGGPKGAATPVIPCWGAVASRSNKKPLLCSLLHQGVWTKYLIFAVFCLNTAALIHYIMSNIS